LLAGKSKKALLEWGRIYIKYFECHLVIERWIQKRLEHAGDAVAAAAETLVE
jgi:hypothetical protein